MECAGKGTKGRCLGKASRRCGRCGAVAYCSVSHQIAHQSVHKLECERLKQQMKCVDMLNDFPFTFSSDATYQVCEKVESRCSFLTKHGIHKAGMWLGECCCGSSLALENSRMAKGWNLPKILCPCREPLPSLHKRLEDWKNYYEWRGIPLNSPVALILHWPLTLYHAIRLVSERSLIPLACDELHVHYLGPDKELCQLAVFGELLALFPGVKINMELVGPAIPQYRDGEKIYLVSYAHCNEVDCVCKSIDGKLSSHIATGKSSAIAIRLHSGIFSSSNHCSKCWCCCLQELVFDH